MTLLLPDEVLSALPKLKEFLKTIGINPDNIKDSNLFLCAFVHKSYASDFKENYAHNERLEFLGDSILWSIIAKQLFLDFPQMAESVMTLYKIALVREETLAIVAKKIGLNNSIFISKWEEKNNGREKASIISDALESLIGYLAIDMGYDVAQKFVLKYIYSEIDSLSISVKSHKTMAQEYIQKQYKQIPIYKDYEEKKDDKNNVLVYRSEIQIEEWVLAIGFWTNKKKAQEDAARSFCEHENLTSSWKWSIKKYYS